MQMAMKNKRPEMDDITISGENAVFANINGAERIAKAKGWI